MSRHRAPRSPTPGWERQPVSIGYAVAYKKPRSGKLVWIHTRATTPTEASAIARESAVARKLPDKGYVEYGVSLTYYRIWPPIPGSKAPSGYTEMITRQEYLAVASRAP